MDQHYGLVQVQEQRGASLAGHMGRGGAGRGGACSREPAWEAASPQHPAGSAAAVAAHQAATRPGSSNLLNIASRKLKENYSLWIGQVLESSKVALFMCFKGQCTNYCKGQLLVPDRTDEYLFIY